jgi:hypothetical protein
VYPGKKLNPLASSPNLSEQWIRHNVLTIAWRRASPNRLLMVKQNWIAASENAYSGERDR